MSGSLRRSGHLYRYFSSVSNHVHSLNPMCVKSSAVTGCVRATKCVMQHYFEFLVIFPVTSVQLHLHTLPLHQNPPCVRVANASAHFSIHSA